MKLLIKYRTQTLVAILAFVVGCLLTLSFTQIDKKCVSTPNPHFIRTKNHNSQKIGSGTYDLIILIISSPKNGDRRQVIRETWLKLKDELQNDNELERFKVKHYFVIGSIKLSADTILHLSTEQSVNNDLLFIDIYDEYANLSSKVLKSFVWLNEQRTNRNFDYDLTLKCDDDTFVRLDALIREVHALRKRNVFTEMVAKSNPKSIDVILDKLDANSIEQIKPEDNLTVRHLYWGYFNGNAKIKTQGKWKESDWILCDNYLPYALGGGYLLSRDLITFIAKNSNSLTLYNSEDVSVGVWLAAVKGVVRKHDIRFDTEWTSRGCKNRFLLTHKHSIKDMKKFYKNIRSTGNLCEKEESKRRSYEYDWKMPPSKCCTKDASL